MSWVSVKGESMAGRDIHDGDVVWIDPTCAYCIGDVVLASVTSSDTSGLALKTYAGEDLMSEPYAGCCTQVHCSAFEVLGRALGVWHPIPRWRGRPTLTTM